MQLQRDVGIFGGVEARLLERDLIEGELVLALTGNVLEVDRLARNFTYMSSML